MLFKFYISRAFCQLKVGDIDLLGLKQTSYFIFQLAPFEYRHGTIFFEKVTDSIRFIMKNHRFPDLSNYVDDLIYCGTPSTIFSAYERLSSLLVQLGLQINVKNYALFNISIHIEHIPCKPNVVADLLSRFKFDQPSWDLLKTHASDPVWIPTHADLMCLNYNI